MLIKLEKMTSDEGKFLIPPREDIKAIMTDHVDKRIKLSTINITATCHLVKALEKANRLPPGERRAFKHFMKLMLPRDF